MNVYIDIKSDRYESSPIGMALRAICNASGATIAEALVGDGEEMQEADLAIVNSIPRALEVLKETEGTKVIAVYYWKRDRSQFEGIANRFPNRLRAATYVAGDESEQEVVKVLFQELGK